MTYTHTRVLRRYTRGVVYALSLTTVCAFAACTSLVKTTTPVPLPTRATCMRTVTADVVALEQVYYYNRLGAFNPSGIIYSLRRDVVFNYESDKEKEKLNGESIGNGGEPGKVTLRKDKRPRPLVLRVNEGDCLEVHFTNLLSPDVNGQEVIKDPETGREIIVDSEEPATRHASMHVNGLNYVQGRAPDGSIISGIQSDGANVGMNESSLAAPGESRTYTWYAKAEGGYLFYSMGAAAGGEGDGGQLGLGLFGSVNVEPKGATWYRSQVTSDELQLSTKKDPQGNVILTKYGQPVVDYNATFPGGVPVLRMLNDKNEIIYSDLNAVIDLTEEHEGCHDKTKFYELGEGNSCGKPYREFTTIFHDEITAVQAFSELEDEASPYRSVRDGMAINYGAGGMGATVLANRKAFEGGPENRGGPAKDCAECKLEEFFLTSWANGDPAMVVERDENNKPKALYPDDPSNVHHSYLGDPVRFRNMHAGPKETHVFHLHAHQWVQDKHDPNSVYLDSQTISPGASFTYDIHYGGSGNRNMTVGDSIFHCHLYPHFAQGMWELWRSHDVFEDGSENRRLPDGEIKGGTPNPAIVPLPRTPLPPMPSKEADGFKGYPFFIAGEAGHRPPQAPLDLDEDDYVKDGVKTLKRHVVQSGSTPRQFPKAVEEMIKAESDADCRNGSAGIDLYDQGRRTSACTAGRVRVESGQPGVLALARELDKANIKMLPLNGDEKEVRAINFHAGKSGTLNEPGEPYPSLYHGGAAKGYPTCKLKNEAGTSDVICDEKADMNQRVLFRVNGQPEKPGAPYADPCPVQYYRADGKEYPVEMREYRAAYVQFDMTVNKSGWHDPQARIAVLEQDIASTFGIRGIEKRTPEPLFFRARSGECIIFKATNLMPSNLNLDDFQVFSPTDVIGQHIHLVKFDVTSSDGSGNGWNYEDGTLSADEVRERIVANNKYQIEHHGTQILTPKTHRLFRTGEMFDEPRGKCPELPANKNDAAAWDAWSAKASKDHPWCGAQTTIQRWWADPLLNKKPGEIGAWDRTIRTVFTHDHFGASSHQHHGLYAALVVEPPNSKWTYLNGDPMGGVGADGKPKRVLDQNGVLRTDGGPTSYAANVIARESGFACLENPNDPSKCADQDSPDVVDARLTGREFGLAFADYALVYTKDNKPVNPVNPLEGALPNPSVHPRRPAPEGISTKDPGTQLLNYRNEPIPLRIAAAQPDGSYRQKFYDPKECEDPTVTVLGGATCAGNMAYVFSSLVHGDPATPLLRAYNGDRVQLRLIQGAQEENHIFNMHGMKWLSQPDSRNSGFMNAQPIGISEHFEFNVIPTDPGDPRGNTDYLYSSTATDNLWDGQWGLLRAYNADPQKTRSDLKRLPVASNLLADAADSLASACGPHPSERHISAWHAREILPGGAVVYNEQFGIKDPNAILFVEDPLDEKTNERITNRAEQMKALQQRFQNQRPEPLILRVAAGQCMTVSLVNRLLTLNGPFDKMPDSDLSNSNAWSFNYPSPITESFNFNQVRSSSRVSLHPQLVALNTFNDDGAAIGRNNDSTVAPCTEDEACEGITYTWYAGHLEFKDGKLEKPKPIEYGAVALRDMADVIKHASHGAIGALVVEPKDALFSGEQVKNNPALAQKYAHNKCGPDPGSKASATICDKDATPLFREFVVLYQDDLSLQQDGQAMQNLRNADDAEDTGQKAFNYRTEPLWARIGANASATPEETSSYDFSNVFSSQVQHAGCNTPPCDPATPVFTAPSGMEVRFRVVHPAGHPRNHGFTVFGHDWSLNPWECDPNDPSKMSCDSSKIGSNIYSPTRIGSVPGIGPTRHVNIVTEAGGDFRVPGDYLYRTQEGFMFSGGLWGILRVCDGNDSAKCDTRGQNPQSSQTSASVAK